MRLHRLEVEGFGPFRERQVVDFDAYADDGIFLITGRTGTGKSSILDAVCFALYGGVPRYESGERRLRSDHCAPDDVSEVVVEFSTGERRFRVTRAPEYERPKRRGTGMAIEAHRAALEEDRDGVWTGLAARPVDVAHELEQILQLTQQQFLQVILLAQGRFARFLLAKNDERQALLRTLFGTRRFEEYEKALEQRRRIAEAAAGAGADQMAMVLDEARRIATDAGIEVAASADPAEVARVADRAAYRAETAQHAHLAAETALHAAEAALAARTAEAERQRQRDRSRLRLAELESRSPGIDAERRTLAEAARAEGLRADVEKARSAATAAEAARAGEQAARAAWADLPAREVPRALALGDEIDEGDVLALRALADEATADRGAWRAAVLAEAALDDLAAATAAAQGLLADLDERRARADKAASDRPAALAALDMRLEEAQAAAALLPAARERRRALGDQRDAAARAERLAEALRAAESTARDAGEALAAAAAHVAALLRRRLDGFAGELAATLVPGDPCAVCGAREHPHPAQRTPGAVDADTISAAEQAKAAAARVDADATSVLADARARHAEAAASAGGRSSAQLDAELAVASAEFVAAETAEALLRTLREERAALVAENERAAEEQAVLADERAAAAESLAVATERLDAARRTVAQARGDHATVVDRLDAVARVIRCARDLADAAEERTAAVRRAVDAATARDAALRRLGFDDETTALAALRDDDARAELEARIHAHDLALATERAALLELELEVLPEEPIDLAPFASAADLARAERATAAAALARAEQVAQTLRALAGRAAHADADTARLRDEHEIIARLAHTVAGKAPNTRRMTLETFVLAAELEEIVAAANLRLSDMSDGRYRLRHTDARAARGAASGLGVEIMDAHTGRARPTQSLSGGETFLASLALALGLAEVVTGRAGGIRLDTLFIDEGFGSLDPETLDVAMRTLDELRQGGRTIGLISHVETMKDQVPAQLHVEASAQGPSVIRHRVSAPH
jgi:exonuclease SbcC